jgi:hypothetical protein
MKTNWSNLQEVLSSDSQFRHWFDCRPCILDVGHLVCEFRHNCNKSSKQDLALFCGHSANAQWVRTAAAANVLRLRSLPRMHCLNMRRQIERSSCYDKRIWRHSFSCTKMKLHIFQQGLVSYPSMRKIVGMFALFAGENAQLVVLT